MTILQRLKKWLSGIVSDEPCSHVFGRPFDHWNVTHTDFLYQKQCKKCGMVRNVKRRVKKETK